MKNVTAAIHEYGLRAAQKEGLTLEHASERFDQRKTCCIAVGNRLISFVFSPLLSG